MSERRVFRIEVSSPEAALDDFARAWDALVDGAKLSPVEALGFESLGDLLNSLTPECWELIDRIRRHGPTPVPSNAISIPRRSRDPEADIEALVALGICERDAAGNLSVPWEEIDLWVPLAA